MARKHSDTAKYSNHSSMNGKPLAEGYVLVPFWIQKGSKFSRKDVIKKNCTSFRIAGHAFYICFIPIKLEDFDDYMDFFWDEIYSLLKKIRRGRCVIGHNIDGTPKCCPKTNRCTDCPHKDNEERYNPYCETDRLISLDELMSTSIFDIEDPYHHSPEAVICENELSDEALREWVMTSLESINQRYAQIIKLCEQRASAAEISKEIGLAKSRCYQEIKNAYNLCCDLLDLTCYKK